MVDMNRIILIFIAGIVLVVFGVLTPVIANTMLPVMLQSQSDLQNADISGVALTTSQSNLVANMGNLNLLMLLIVPTILIIAGVIVILFGAFVAFKTK